jgi:hypothetical protein
MLGYNPLTNPVVITVSIIVTIEKTVIFLCMAKCTDEERNEIMQILKKINDEYK